MGKFCNILNILLFSFISLSR